MKKIKKGFTLIEIMIVISFLWILFLMLIPSGLSFNHIKYRTIITKIKQCNFIQKDNSNNLIYCYYDKNNNNRLDNTEYNTRTKIQLKKDEMKLLNNLNIVNDKIYFIYKKKYLFQYNKNTDILDKKGIIL